MTYWFRRLLAKISLKARKKSVVNTHCQTHKNLNIHMINLVLFGPPGSGKGTQAALLVDKYQLVHISTGDLFRSEIGNNTELGLKAKSYMEKGELVPDEVTIGMLKNKVLANQDAKGFIFDGFPRTSPQAAALDDLMNELGQEITALIALEVPEEEVVKRILLRANDSGRADDADESIIRNRFSVYQKETSIVFDYYHEQNKSYKVEGMGSIDEIQDNLCKVIDSL
jgi:adenylate kinase